MINGVLTERTVKEVVPILKTNSDGLKKTLEELVKQYKLKQDDMEKWKVCSLSSSVYALVTISQRRG
jgi:prefoldin subunit 2